MTIFNQIVAGFVSSKPSKASGFHRSISLVSWFNKKTLIALVLCACQSISATFADTPKSDQSPNAEATLANLSSTTTSSKTEPEVVDLEDLLKGKSPILVTPKSYSDSELSSIDNPAELLLKSTQFLLHKIDSRPEFDDEEAQNKYNFDVVNNLISPIVDFNLIAKRVMTKYYKFASKAQREKFREVFKVTLINTYSLAMSNYSDQKIELVPDYKVSNKSKFPRTSITMNIYGSEGRVYPLVYSMYEREAGDWQVENLTLNGVNLGLTFRNQFNQAIKSHSGNIDQLIDNWNVSNPI